MKTDLGKMPLKEGHQVMLMGTADVVALPTEKIVFLEDMTDTQKAAKVRILKLLASMSICSFRWHRI